MAGLPHILRGRRGSSPCAVDAAPVWITTTIEMACTQAASTAETEGRPMAPIAAFYEPRLPRPVVETSKRLLSAALACRIAVDVCEVSEARRWALEVISLAQELHPAVEQPLIANPKPQEPQQLCLPAI